MSIPAWTTATSMSYMDPFWTAAAPQPTISSWHTTFPATPSNFTENVNFEKDITIQGISLKKTLEDINKRLSILRPDPKLLDKYEALQKLYEQYIMLEKLLQEDANGKEN